MDRWTRSFTFKTGQSLRISAGQGSGESRHSGQSICLHQRYICFARFQNASHHCPSLLEWTNACCYDPSSGVQYDYHHIVKMIGIAPEEESNCPLSSPPPFLLCSLFKVFKSEMNVSGNNKTPDVFKVLWFALAFNSKYLLFLNCLKPFLRKDTTYCIIHSKWP